MTRDRLALYFCVFVSCIWGFGALLGALTKDYTVLQVSTPVIIAVAAYLLTAGVLGRNGMPRNGGAGRNGGGNGTSA